MTISVHIRVHVFRDKDEDEVLCFLPSLAFILLFKGKRVAVCNVFILVNLTS